MTPTPTLTDLVESVESIVDSRLRRLQDGYRKNRSEAVAALARLRRGVGKPPGSVLDILEHTHAPEFVTDPTSDAPTPAEIAAHISLTLYAVHQQSQPDRMHRPGQRLGRSVRALINEREGKRDAYVTDPVARRFAMLGTADSLEELTHHLRGIVQLLRAKAIPLDYGRLAADLVRWQLGRGASVRLVWGRDFHFTKPTNQTEQQ